MTQGNFLGVVNLSDVFRDLRTFEHFPAPGINLSNFYVKHKSPYFRRKFGDQSQ